MSKCILKDP